MIWHRQRPVLRLVLCAALLLLAVPASADYLDSYKAGVEAIDRGDWDRAGRLMREAIAGRTKESRRILKRRYLKRYTPHYLLGLALFELGDCPGALRAWRESTDQGFITKTCAYDTLTAKRQLCQSSHRGPTPHEPAETRAAKVPTPIAAKKTSPEQQKKTERTAPSPSPRPPPRALILTLESFIAGDYARVLERAASLGDDDPTAYAHARLLLAAARFALAQTVDEEQESHLAAAHEALCESLKTDPELIPSEAFFSPRFRELFAASSCATPTLNTPQ